MNFQELIESSCWSDYEGCVCGLSSNHEGLHKCFHCDVPWDDDMSAEWEQKMNTEIQKMIEKLK